MTAGGGGSRGAGGRVRQREGVADTEWKTDNESQINAASKTESK